MSVTGEDIVAAHGRVRHPGTQDGRELGARRKLPIPSSATAWRPGAS